MIDDLDTRLSELAPGVRPREEFRRNLRMVLRSQAPAEEASVRVAPRPRRHRVLALIAAMFVLTLIVGEGGQQLGSLDFELEQDVIPGLHEGTEYNVVRSKFGNNTVTSSAEMDVEHMEEVVALKAANLGRFTGASGWTVADATCFQADYAYEVDGKTTTITNIPDDSPDVLTPEIIAFVRNHLAFSLAAIDEGRAASLPPEEVVIDGMSVTMRKWLVVAPDGTEAVYWESYESSE